MSAPSGSLRVHFLAEHLRGKGFWLETHEVDEMGPIGILSELYGIRVCLSFEEFQLLKSEMLDMAAENEMKEARAKARELWPEDQGKALFRQDPAIEGDSSTCFTMPYCYPVDENLRLVARPSSGASFPFRKEAPTAGVDAR